MVIAALAVVAGIYTVDAATVGDQSYPAVVSTSKVYDLNFANTGTVVAINVKPGQQVKAGQVLATQNLGTLDAQLHADQQVVAADQAAVQQDSAPQPTSAQNEQNGLQVQQQQTALTNAQAALTATTQTGAANVAAAQGAVTSAEAVAQSDSTLYTQACPNGPVPPDPSLTGTAAVSAQNLFTHCQQLQSTSASDQAAVAKAQAQVPVVQAQAMQATNTAQATVNAAQAALNLAQYQGTLQRAPANAEAQAQAKAALNQATAQMDQVQQEEPQATIVAPADGVVAQVNGSTGENLGPAGVPAYKAPASIQTSQPSGFSLFPSQPTPSGIVGGQWQPAPRRDRGRHPTGHRPGPRIEHRQVPGGAGGVGQLLGAGRDPGGHRDRSRPQPDRQQQRGDLRGDRQARPHRSRPAAGDDRHRPVVGSSDARPSSPPSTCGAWPFWCSTPSSWRWSCSSP